MIRWLYNLCFPVVFLVMLPGFLRRMVKRGNFRRHFSQRFGFFPVDVRKRLTDGPPRPWLQAVSVGEMLVALKLIAALREREPRLPLVLSTTTTTGFQLAQERAPAGVELIYTPIDFPGMVRRALRVIQPSHLVIVDGGLWPNLLWEAKKRKIPTALVNARMSPRSERRFRRFRWVTTSLFGSLDLVAVTEKTDLARWQNIGVPMENLRWTGSVKFDDTPADGSGRTDATEVAASLRLLLSGVGVPTDARVLLAGSTHPGEEKIIGEIYQRLRQACTDLFLIVAPRHVERASSVRADLEALGLRVVNRSALPADGQRGDVILIDTTGELRDWYTVATIVFIGKSLAAQGGQNPAEAVAAGKPVLFGPHMENFSDFVSALLAADAAVQVNDAEELETACARLLADPASAQAMARNASCQLDEHRGAAARTADLLLAQAKISPC